MLFKTRWRRRILRDGDKEPGQEDGKNVAEKTGQTVVRWTKWSPGGSLRDYARR
jgi:hypothetical protein